MSLWAIAQLSTVRVSHAPGEFGFRDISDMLAARAAGMLVPIRAQYYFVRDLDFSGIRVFLSSP